MMNMRPASLKLNLSFNGEIDNGQLRLRNKLVFRPVSLRKNLLRVFSQTWYTAGPDWPRLHHTLL